MDLSIIDKYSTEIIGGLSVAILLFIFKKVLELFNNLLNTKKYSGYIGEYYLYTFLKIPQNNSIYFDNIPSKL